MHWTLKYIIKTPIKQKTRSLVTENLSKSTLEENETHLPKSNNHPLKQVKHNIPGDNSIFKESSLISSYIHQRR